MVKFNLETRKKVYDKARHINLELPLNSPICTTHFEKIFKASLEEKNQNQNAKECMVEPKKSYVRTKF